MPEDRTITVYTFEELSDKPFITEFGVSPKTHALEMISRDLSDFANSDLEMIFSEALSEWGFPTTQIEWSLGYSQGDGMAFYGSVDLTQFARKTGNLKKWAAFLAADPEVTIHRNSFGHHYSHWNTMTVEVDYNGLRTPRRFELQTEIQETLSEAVKTVSRELAALGYDHLEVTEEMVADHCEANEYRFNADGTLA